VGQSVAGSTDGTKKGTGVERERDRMCGGRRRSEGY